jgi:F-type H+-transporting ATPase subunit a
MFFIFKVFMTNAFNFNYLYRDILSPLSQFEIRDLLSIDAPILGNLHISITNIGLYLTIGAFFLLVINLLSTNYNRLVSNK